MENKTHRNHSPRAGSGAGAVFPDADPDPDPQQNYANPHHWFLVLVKNFTSGIVILFPLIILKQSALVPGTPRRKYF